MFFFKYSDFEIHIFHYIFTYLNFTLLSSNNNASSMFWKERQIQMLRQYSGRYVFQKPNTWKKTPVNVICQGLINLERIRCDYCTHQVLNTILFVIQIFQKGFGWGINQAFLWKKILTMRKIVLQQRFEVTYA